MKYLLILLLVCSCATAKKKAIELSEKGRHEEAIQFWAEAIKKDPDDEEVRNGFQSSLDFVSNDRLTRIRDKRLSNNQQEALTEMKSLVDLQKKWNIKLDFNSSSFQGKEVNYLWPYYKSTILAKISKKMPLGAESDHREFKDVFNSEKEYESVQTLINQKGKEKCLELKGLQGSRPFFSSYVTQFCNYFKVETTNKNNVSSVLYLRPKLDADITNISDTSLGSLQIAMEKTMKETPWYHPEAERDISVRLKGQYNWKPASERVRQAHNYTEKVPYTDYVTVNKTRSVPYEDVVNGQKVTRYRTESYKEKDPVTKFRDVPRVYEYWAMRNSMEVALNISGSMLLQKETFPFFFQKTIKEEKILHDINLPKIGLYPQREDVLPPLTKFDGLSKDIGEQLKNDLNAIWEKNFCTLPSSRDIASIGENVTRCRRLTKFPEEFVDTWFQNNFGVKSNRAQELLGQF